MITALQDGFGTSASAGLFFGSPFYGDETLNEKRIQQVLEIEKQADAIHAKALNQAAQIPLQAEQEAQALIEKARTEAEAEARKIVEEAQCDAECQRILQEAQERVRSSETLAMSNFDRAVNFVLARVVGRE